MAKIDYDDIEMSLYQVRVIAVNDNYDSDNYDGSTGGINDKNKIIVDPEVANYLNAYGIDTPSAYKKRKGSKK